MTCLTSLWQSWDSNPRLHVHPPIPHTAQAAYSQGPFRMGKKNSGFQKLWLLHSHSLYTYSGPESFCIVPFRSVQRGDYTRPAPAEEGLDQTWLTA